MTESGITYAGGVCEQLGMALGGLGTSTLEIGRDGSFQNLRVQNEWTGKLPPRPQGTFLSVHAHTVSGESGGRVMQLEAPANLAPIRGLTYTGRFPFVELSYQDEALPCEVRLEAFSPFVPQDAEASSLPLVFFTFLLRNSGAEPVTAAAAISWQNDIASERQRPNGWPSSGNRNRVLEGDAPAVLMETRSEGLEGSEYLLACLPPDGVRASAVADWRRGPPGRWMGPNVSVDGPDPISNWQSFLSSGILPEESGTDDGLGRYSYHQPVAAAAVEVELAPGEEKEVRFALVWFFPFHYDRPSGRAKILLGHQYAARFPGGAREIAEWAFPRHNALRKESGAWRALIEGSSLPPNCRALAAEIVYLLPRISWWLSDGTFILFESINCPRMQATILDIYISPVLAALFPELHASSIRATAAFQLDSGEIPSTLGILSIRHPEFRVFNTGDSCVFPIVVVWQMLWNGDPDFVAEMFPVIKKVLQWAERELDMDRDGVPDSHGIDQGWDTFPMHGAAAYIADQWLAALLAGEKVARHLGDAEFAQWCSSARVKAAFTVENLLWNGHYYDLAHDVNTGRRSDICFADQFTYGTVPAGILELGETHPPTRVRQGLESIWRLNVKPCAYVCRMGSNSDGSPADSTVHEEQEGGASQSNSFTPVSTAPLASAAIQYGMVEEGLALAEEMAHVIVHKVKGPWSAELLFDSRNGECFYGLHYSDCLILWDLMYALLGVHVNILEHSLKLAPPRLPVRMPFFGMLFYGQVEFDLEGGLPRLRLSNCAARVSFFRTLEVQVPERNRAGKPTLRKGISQGIETGPEGKIILEEVVVPPGEELCLAWE